MNSEVSVTDQIVTDQTLTTAELDSRLARVKDRMRAQGLDALIVADPSNMFYLTGYNAWSFYTPQILFVPLEGDPVFAMREMDGLGAHRTALKYTANIINYPETLVHNPDAHSMDWVARKLREMGFAKPGNVGFEGDSHFFSVRAFLGLKNGMPEWNLVESRELVNRVRLVKSDFEINQMRKAGRIATEAMTRAVNALEVGRPLNEIAAEVMAAQAQGIAGVDGDYPAIVPMFPRGAGADTPHLTWTAEKIAEDEAVSIELAGVYNRYHAPLARTVSLGKPTADLERVAEATIEGINAALEMMRPGNTPSDVTAAWDAVLAKYGLEKKSRLGYSIGIGFPPDWGERTASIRADDQTELEENMTFHMIAGMWMTGYGFEVSESVRVTANGPEFFTHYPRELIIKK